MTAEIAILNKEAVALAADSAVTYGPKIYNTANKLFMLSRKAPVGIMIFNNSQFMGVPWETLIKYYRNYELKETTFDRLENYVNDFIRFLNSNKDIFTKEVEKKEYQANIRMKSQNIIQKTLKGIEESYVKGELKEKPLDEQLKIVLTNTVSAIHQSLNDLPDIPGITPTLKTKIKKIYATLISEELTSNFRQFPLTREVLKKLKEICILLISKGIVPNHTGLVIAGYGEKEIYPVIYTLRSYIKIDGKFLHSSIHKDEINYDTPAIILPFAQDEMPHTFMEGIDPVQMQHIMMTIKDNILGSFNTSIVEYINNELKTKTIKNFDLPSLKTKLDNFIQDVYKEIDKNWEEYRKEKHVKPIMNAVGALPKDDLASMAESLVNLTSLKRKMSLNQKETVGGPIDVAVISKIDGFIWIKRKHYFNPELNHNFFSRNK